MGVFDFVKDAGAAVGIGQSKAEEAAAKAKAKAAADLKAAQKQQAAQAAAVKAANKKKAAAAAKVKAAKAREAAAKQKEAAMEAAKGAKLTDYVNKMGIKARGLNITYNDGVAYIKGTVANKATKEKLILAVGNAQGVKQVRDSIKVTPARKASAPKNAAARRAAAARRKQAAAAQTMHTVKSGDTLSKLAKKYLGDAMRYPEIFKANQPMLTNPDMIQVGQVLRIPRK